MAQGLLLRQGLFAHTLPLALQALRHRAQGLSPGLQPLPVSRHLLGLGLGFGLLGFAAKGVIKYFLSGIVE